MTRSFPLSEGQQEIRDGLMEGGRAEGAAPGLVQVGALIGSAIVQTVLGGDGPLGPKPVEGQRKLDEAR